MLRCTIPYLGRYEQAITCDNQLLKIYRDVIMYDAHPTLNIRGLALCKLGRYSEAVKCCDTVLEIDPGNHTSLDAKRLALDCLAKP